MNFCKLEFFSGGARSAVARLGSCAWHPFFDNGGTFENQPEKEVPWQIFIAVILLQTAGTYVTL